MDSEWGEYRHWRLEKDADHIVWLTLDVAGKGTNVLSAEVMDELSRIVSWLAANPPRALAIRSGKESGFIAGADVREFTSLTDTSAAEEMIGRGREVLDRLARLPFPTLAIISGFCLGGGLELALACRHRIVADTPGTRLGLPEVKLGIHPGFGGTVRITRLVGPVRGMEMMLSGRGVSPREAKRIGLADLVLPERQLERGARATLLSPPAPRRPGWLERLAGSPPLRPLVATRLRSSVARRAHPEHYPAPFALIDLWERFADNPQEMLREEGRSAASLLTGAASRNLVRLFLLQERLKAIGKVDASPIRTVHVVGGGTMGGAIAAWCALQGLRVTVEEPDRGRLGETVRRAAELFRARAGDRRRSEADLDRLIPDMAGRGAAGADIVIEAIFEDPEAKRALYRRLEPRLRDDAILATNTSSIPLEELASSLNRPGRLVGLHFFNPVERMELVEVVSSAATDPATLARATSLVLALRKLPLQVKSSPGFLVNRVLMPYLLEAILMESEGTPAAEIDRAATAFGMPMGPLALADLVGLDVCLSVARSLSSHLGLSVPERLEALVAAGRLGKKSGEGFYPYGKGKGKKGAIGHGSPPAVVTDRLILPLVNEAVTALREGVVADGDLLDAGVVFGTGFAPFRGGPLQYVRSAGAAPLYGRLRELERALGRRFSPDPGWGELPEGKEGVP